MNNIYSAKISTLNEFGHKRIDQEGIYTSFEKAFDFIKSSFFEKPSNREMKLYRFDISEIKLDSDKILTIWEYNCKGDLLNSIEQVDLNSKKNSADFEKGEIIKLKMTEYWESSNIDTPVLGVISKLPNQGPEEPEFLIDYISNLGFLDHVHVEFTQIEKFNHDIPREFEFLKTLSDYYKGTFEIDNDDLEEIRNCNVYLKNIKTYKELINNNN